MNPAYDSLYQRAADLAAAITAASGPAAIRTIFAGGSLGTGEVSAREVDGRLEIYSDVDLYVVIADARDRVRVAKLAREVAGRTSPGGLGVVYAATTDVGIYTTAELCALEPRPGTVSLSRSHVHLVGDETLYAELVAAFERAMDPLEGLYLIENRIAGLTMLAAGENDTDARYRRYCIGKLLMDVGAAHLIALGKFETTRELQRAALDNLEDAEALPSAEMALIDAGSEVGETQAIAFALLTWRRNALWLLPVKDTWLDMICVRCGRGKRLLNWRRYVAMSGSLGTGKLRAIAEGLTLHELNARDACRLAALAHHVTTIHSSEDISVFTKYLSRLTRTLAGSDDTVLEKALHLYRSTH